MRQLLALALVVSLVAAADAATAVAPVLSLHASVTGAARGGLMISLSRWSTDAEREPVIAALLAPAPAPAPPPAAGPTAGRAGRGGPRGGGRGTPPLSPVARLSAAVKAAPTLGYIWGDGVTGYSIKYAWHAPATTGDRVVLITERRLGAHASDWAIAPGPAPDAEFTLIEMHLGAGGAGEGKTSLTTSVAVDAAAKTIALDGYAAAPAFLKVTR